MASFHSATKAISDLIQMLDPAHYNSDLSGKMSPLGRQQQDCCGIDLLLWIGSPTIDSLFSIESAILG